MVLGSCTSVTHKEEHSRYSVVIGLIQALVQMYGKRENMFSLAIQFEKHTDFMRLVLHDIQDKRGTFELALVCAD